MTKPKAKIKPETRPLKFCPFCGGQAENEVVKSEEDVFVHGQYWFFFTCTECYCQGPLAQSKGDAKILWNGRD